MSRLALENELNETSPQLDSVQQLQTTIESGSVLVSRILNIRNGLEVFNEDSLSLYPVPLEVEVDETSYELEIDGTTYDLTISYEREQTLNVERVLRITASSLSASSRTFTPIFVECPETNPNCGSGATLITCYF